MGRPKKASAQIDSIDQANEALCALLRAEVELENQVGAADLARASATAKYESAIDAQRKRIGDLTLQLQNWYMTNAAELEKDGRKSVQLTYGVLGRRLSNPALKPLNRAWTWAAIGVKLRSIYNERFFRAAAPEIDKDLVKAELTAEQLGNVGLKVHQEDNFYIEIMRLTLGENV